MSSRRSARGVRKRRRVIPVLREPREVGLHAIGIRGKSTERILDRA